MGRELHPLDAGLLEIGAPVSGLPFPPKDWLLLKERWGLGYGLRHRNNGLCVLIDCSQKDDDCWWVHVSVSRARHTPDHEDMAQVHRDFLGERYAYSVWAPPDVHVNIHAHCLHLWALVDHDCGKVLPEFSEVLSRVGRSI